MERLLYQPLAEQEHLSYVLVEIPGNVTGAATGVFTGVPAGTYTVFGKRS